MFLLLRQQYDLCGIVLEQVGGDAETDAGRPPSHYVALAKERQ